MGVICRESEEPHQLHFDMREAALRQGLDTYRLDHPVSLLLFLLSLSLLLFFTPPEHAAQQRGSYPFESCGAARSKIRTETKLYYILLYHVIIHYSV